MKKMKTLFEMDYSKSPPAQPVVRPECLWVGGEGVKVFVKLDGTSMMIRDRQRFKRYDRKLTKAGRAKIKKGLPADVSFFKTPPAGFEPCNESWDAITYHWPGWVPVGDGPEDRRHREAHIWGSPPVARGTEVTYELIGEGINGNPYGLSTFAMAAHTSLPIKLSFSPWFDFELARFFIKNLNSEGVVFHHPDGRMCKLRRKDFGFAWPIPKGE